MDRTSAIHRWVVALLAGAALFAGALALLFQIQSLGGRVAGLHDRMGADARRIGRCGTTLDRARARLQEAEAAPAPDFDADELGDLTDALDRSHSCLNVLEEEALASGRILEERADAPVLPETVPGEFPRLAALPADQGAAIRIGVHDILTRDERLRARKRREVSVKQAVEQLTDRLALSPEQGSSVETLYWAHLEALKSAAPGAGEEHILQCRQSLRGQIGRLLDARQTEEFDGVELPHLQP